MGNKRICIGQIDKRFNTSELKLHNILQKGYIIITHIVSFKNLVISSKLSY